MKLGNTLFFTLILIVILSSCKPLHDNKGSAPPVPEAGEVWYQIFLRSFADSDGDGIGDIRGLINRMDYLADLGIEGIWLLPVHTSPSYHKYDVQDYYSIDPVYGTMDDFRDLLTAAHQRGIRVILDMVLNHTDDEHFWFQEALKGPENPYRNYYVWADSAEEQENPHHWHAQPADGDRQNESAEYFEGFFWKGMPDLNYDHPPVREDVLQIAAFWLDSMGVDGFRLDAALHIYPFYVQARDSLLIRNIQWWQEFRSEVDRFAPEAFLIGEIWEGDSITGQFLDQALDACFNFSLSQEITECLQGKRSPASLVPLLLSRYQVYASFDPSFQDATFLSNHDQNRIATILQGHPEKLKLAASILLTLPGTPFIYYGEEIGMRGHKPDEQIREPIIWDQTGRAADQTNWEPLLHNVPDSIRSIAEQRQDAGSLWHHYATLIQLRKEMPALHSGSFRDCQWLSLPPQVLAFERGHADKHLLVMHNLGDTPIRIDVLPEFGEIIFSSKTKPASEDDHLDLPGYSTLILDLDR